MKKFVLPLLILFMSGLYIFFIPEDPASVKITFKLIPMVLIIIYAYLHCNTNPKPAQWIIITGLFICMLGDGLIAGSFIFGLAAFLTGHLFYLFGFIRTWKFSKTRFAMIILIFVYSFLISNELVKALMDNGNSNLIIPVIAYVFVISLMAWSAIMTGNKWAIAGSFLFVLSDSILSWNLFVSDVPQSSLLIMSTYYTAQFLIAHSLGSLLTKSRKEGL
ncbi:lysoplasmalogenase [Mesobacillus sp. AQ2]|uniref:lysoplasmalogenase n=1 Tax=unclassified Mesobacillus TaxID=2675270 RepID=UPI00203D8A2F|nr:MULTISPECIES: lysoplasmalogenase [unclassified Mesobacillus]MCM3124974.1 lysoplasmalogenase [Mesobacillus sp. MER 33]MCM3235266.1 lysoplasmalogenase [Mesobacillus sp. MER 48]WHX39802.1 lysoplasmalogenase [Mesobacillus sp. AQ2]